jgi:hypothetical protein
MVNTDARFKVKDVGKINVFIYCEADGDTSKHSLQSSRPAPTTGTKSEWVGAPRTRSGCVVARFLRKRVSWRARRGFLFVPENPCHELS